MREGQEPKAPRHASAAATRDNRLPHSRQFRNLQGWYGNSIAVPAMLHPLVSNDGELCGFY